MTLSSTNARQTGLPSRTISKTGSEQAFVNRLYLRSWQLTWCQVKLIYAYVWVLLADQLRHCICAAVLHCRRVLPQDQAVAGRCLWSTGVDRCARGVHAAAGLGAQPLPVG